MLYTHLAEQLQSGLRHSSVDCDVPLAPFTTLRLGGPASIFVQIGSQEDTALCLRLARAEGCPVLPLGHGSNLLIGDEGFAGMVLHFGDAFSEIQMEEKTEGVFVTAQAGTTLQKLCNAAADASLTGLEFASGIPGSVGGAVTMNAGAYGSEISQVLERTVLLQANGRTSPCAKENLHLGYRRSLILERKSSTLVLSATFRLQKGSREEIQIKMKDYAKRRREKQPVQVPSCGSTFKRPEGHFAGTLIEQCGLKGFRIGGCSVSTLHAGFLLNDQNGTSADYLALIREVQRVVLKQTGILLEPEVQIVPLNGFSML